MHVNLNDIDNNRSGCKTPAFVKGAEWYWALTAAVGIFGGAVGAVLARSWYKNWKIIPKRLKIIVTGSNLNIPGESIEILDDVVVDPKKPDAFDPRPRKGYLSWDDYFMCVAFLSAQRSKDPNKQVGACIVSSDQIILGIGYNGFPRGCPDDELPWAKCARSGSPLDTKYPYVCHAELNAILNKNTASLQGAKMYVTMFPCNECSKLLIQAGIREIVFYEDKAAPPVRHSSPNEAPNSNIRQEDAYAASKRLLRLAGVKSRQHQLDRPLVFCVGVHALKTDIPAETKL